MQKQLALIADSANISRENKLNILGEFDTLWAREVPIAWPVMWFVAKLKVEGADVGTRQLLLRIVDEDGNTVVPPLTGILEIPAPGEDFSGYFPSIPIVLGVQNARFPDFGAYSFELRVDDAILAEVPLYVKKRQEVSESEA
jgi:hypothetical protein